MVGKVFELKKLGEIFFLSLSHGADKKRKGKSKIKISSPEYSSVTLDSLLETISVPKYPFLRSQRQSLWAATAFTTGGAALLGAA